MPEIVAPQESLTRGLSQLRAAEAAVLKALPAIVASAASDQLRELLAKYLTETEAHGVRIGKMEKELARPIESSECPEIDVLVGKAGALLSGECVGAEKDIVLIRYVREIAVFKMGRYQEALQFASPSEPDKVQQLIISSFEEEKNTLAGLERLEGELSAGTLRREDSDS